MAENEQDPPPEAEDTAGNCEPSDCSSEPMETAPTTDQSEAVHDSINNELVPEIKNEPSVAPETELKADPEADPVTESDPAPAVSAGDIPLEDLEDGELSSDDGTESPAKTSASNHKGICCHLPFSLLGIFLSPLAIGFGVVDVCVFPFSYANGYMLEVVFPYLKFFHIYFVLDQRLYCD